MAATPDEQPLTFVFPAQPSVSGTSDGEGVPFDPNAPVVYSTATSVVVPCGVEYLNTRREEGTPFGAVQPSQIRVTLFDEDYQVVQDARWVELEGERYQYTFDEAPSGLFGVGLHYLIFTHEGDR